MDLPRYEYQPLNESSDEIRVLELGRAKTRIEIRIRHVPVSSGSFQALSYVWGKPDQFKEAIVLDDLGRAIGWIPLTKNLGDAMCDLQNAEELNQKVFWIDQICINQQNDKEKSQQVAKMSQIYTHARRVITYLGPGWRESDEERGMRLLKRITGNIPDDTWQRVHDAGSIEELRDRMDDGRIRFEPLPSDLYLASDESYYEDEISKRYRKQGWKWLIHVAYGEWNQRLWIVQEQILNKEIIMLRGHRLIDWNAVAVIPILFGAEYLPWQILDTSRRKSRENSVSVAEVERTMYGIWWERYARLEPGTDYTWSGLLDNLEWYRPLRCADLRDRVYAILAISLDTQTLGLEPNYSADNTIDALSQQLSVRLLQSADSLVEVLSYAISWRRPNSKLPSWCLPIDRPAGKDSAEILSPNLYEPHPEELEPVQFHMENTILAVKGRIIDFVSAPHATIAWSLEGSSNESPVESLSNLMHLLLEDPSTEHIVTLFRTIIAEDPWAPPLDARVGENEALASQFLFYLQHRSRLLVESANDSETIPEELLERCNQVMAKIRAYVPSIVPFEFETDEDMTTEEDLISGRMLWYAEDSQRHLGRTRAGRFCNAVHTAQEGDAIMAVQGTDRLFIVRSVGQTYTLIGDIYVDGLMHGEAYENQDPSEVDCEIHLA